MKSRDDRARLAADRAEAAADRKRIAVEDFAHSAEDYARIMRIGFEAANTTETRHWIEPHRVEMDAAKVRLSHCLFRLRVVVPELAEAASGLYEYRRGHQLLDEDSWDHAAREFADRAALALSVNDPKRDQISA